MKIYVIFILVFFVPHHQIRASKESRQKRQWLWYNPTEKTFVGFIYTVPFQMFLPGLGPRKGARSLSQNTQKSEDLSHYYFQPQYGTEIEKTLLIFNHLNIWTVGCQERLICLLSSNPEQFYPLSDLILRNIRDKYGPIEVSEKSFIYRYNKAMKMGMISTLQKCEDLYSECPLSQEKMINYPMLKLWQSIISFTGMYLSK